MNAFPLLAVLTLCISFAALQASFEDLREAPLVLTRDTTPMRALIVRSAAAVHRSAGAMNTIDAADEGLLNRELASADPLQAWLDRYLMPPVK